MLDSQPDGQWSFWSIAVPDRLGPTLVSAILHMAAIILLAIFTLKGSDSGGIELSILPTEELADEQFDELDLASFDAAEIAAPEVTLEFEPITPPTDAEALAAISDDLSLSPAMDGSLTDLTGNSGGLARGAGKARTSVFGLAAEGTRFVYLFDRSGSMNSTFQSFENGVLFREITPLMLAKEEMLRSLQPLTPTDQFQIVFYNQRPMLFDNASKLRRLIPASPERKSEAQQFVLNVPGNGTTNHVAALETGIDLKPDVIFLITDGEEQDDPSANRIRRMIRTCQQQGTQVHIIHFSTEVRHNCTLLPLAEQTGGAHRFMNLSSVAGL